MPDAQSSNGIPTLFIYAQATRQITILKIERYKYYLRAATQTSNDEPWSLTQIQIYGINFLTDK